MCSFSVACSAGRFFNLKSGRCEDCDFGFYQSKPASFECVPCGVGKTTVTTTSTSVDDCKGQKICYYEESYLIGFIGIICSLKLDKTWLDSRITPIVKLVKFSTFHIYHTTYCDCLTIS